MKRFLNLIVYILSVHLSALIITGLFRGVLFISSHDRLYRRSTSGTTALYGRKDSRRL